MADPVYSTLRWTADHVDQRGPAAGGLWVWSAWSADICNVALTTQKCGAHDKPTVTQGHGAKRAQRDREFLREPRQRRLSKLELEDAMRRLFAAGKIRVETYGTSSKSYSRVVMTEGT